MEPYFRIQDKPLFVVLMKIILASFILVTLLRGEYVWVIALSFSFFLTLVPSILKKDFNVRLPIIFEVAITVSVFLHLIGGYVGLYWVWNYYDMITHLISSLTISLIGVTILYILVYSFRVICLPPWGFGIFTILFAMSMGVAWEFLEWFSDAVWATGLQVDLNDTMVDLVFDTIAGALVGIAMYRRLKRGENLDVMVTMEDVKKSVGYRRWHLLNKKERNMMRSIYKSMKDPYRLERFVDMIVDESKEFSERQKKLWLEMGKKR